MKIALIGATGFVGKAVLAELLARGHAVTAITSRPERVPPATGLTAVRGDAYEAASIAQVVAGHDAVVSTFNPGWDKADIRALFVRGHQGIVAGIKAAGVQRFLEVGGAGSLYVAPGLQLIDTPDFPAAYREGAEGARQALNLLREERELDWVFLSPPAMLAPGPRTGRYQVGGDQLLMAGAAPAGISDQDLAAAIVDELEQPRHHRQRFTVAAAA